MSSSLVEGFWTRIALRFWAALVLLFLFIPIVIILLYAFNSSNIETWPLPGLSTKWLGATWNDPEIQTALGLSLQAGLAATGLALVLGSMAAFAIHRSRFFGRDVISLLFILPLALPGIVTGISLNSFFHFTGITFSLLTIIVGHTTFCIVVVYNNGLADRSRDGPRRQRIPDLQGHHPSADRDFCGGWGDARLRAVLR